MGYICISKQCGTSRAAHWGIENLVLWTEH